MGRALWIGFTVSLFVLLIVGRWEARVQGGQNENGSAHSMDGGTPPPPPPGAARLGPTD